MSSQRHWNCYFEQNGFCSWILMASCKFQVNRSFDFNRTNTLSFHVTGPCSVLSQEIFLACLLATYLQACCMYVNEASMDNMILMYFKSCLYCWEQTSIEQCNVSMLHESNARHYWEFKYVYTSSLILAAKSIYS